MVDANLPPNYEAVLRKLANPPAAHVQHYSTEGLRAIRRSTLEVMAQVDSPQASPATVDYSKLIQKVVDVYDTDMKDKKVPEILKNGDSLYAKLTDPLNTLRGVINPDTLSNSEKNALGGAFGNYGIILSSGRKDRQGAMINFKEAVRINPKDYYSLASLAAGHFLDGDITTAKQLIDRAHRLKPEDQDINFLYKRINSWKPN